MIKIGFQPIFDKNSKILILGSFPSVKSRNENFYYGHKQNRFWKIVAKAKNEEIPTSIEDKKKLLFKYKIALWDMVQSCEIEGSLDSAIKNPEIADLSEVMNNSSIQLIICNGKKAYILFQKYYPNLLKIAINLPSTSPANTKFDESIWINALNQI